MKTTTAILIILGTLATTALLVAGRPQMEFGDCDACKLGNMAQCELFFRRLSFEQINEFYLASLNLNTPPKRTTILNWMAKKLECMFSNSYEDLCGDDKETSGRSRRSTDAQVEENEEEDASLKMIRAEQDKAEEDKVKIAMSHLKNGHLKLPC